MTCPKLKPSFTSTSKVTQKKYNLKNNSIDNLYCKSQNIIYLLTYSNFSVQYVEETLQPLNKRIIIHRTKKYGCEHIVNNYKNVYKGHHFYTQIIKVFCWNWNYNNNKLDPKITETLKTKQSQTL